MNVHFTILLAAEICSVFTQIHALPGWWWGSSSKHKYWDRHGSDRVNVCLTGQCVQAWKCPKSAVSNQSSDHCGHWNNRAMVCCVFNNPDVTSSETFVSSEHSKSTKVPNVQNSFPSEVVHESRISTKSIDDDWNRNSWDRPISISSSRVSSSPRYNSNNVPERTPHNSIRDSKTTISWNKPRTSDFRVVFPTESVWLSRTTRRPTYTTRKFKETSDNKVTKSWMLPLTVPTAATTSYFTKNTKRTTSGSTSTTKKFNRTSNSGYTKSWVTRSTTTMAPWTSSTKYPKQPISKTEFFTKSWNKATDYKSTKLWPTRSTTVRGVGYPSKTTPRAVIRPTNFPSVAKPTEYYKVTTQVKFTSTKPDNNRRPDWDKSTKRTSTNKPRTTRSTRTSTRRYSVTTPLPNVNTHLCGIRVERSNSNRGRRNYEKKYETSGDKIYSSRSPTSRQPYQRIVGGEEVEPFSWPWVAALYKVTSPSGNRFLCAGSLINKNFVLTAAHVFTPDDLRSASYFVMLGTHNAQDAVAQYLVASVLRHPRYENRYYYYDIALLKLEKPVIFNNYVMPVCLPSPDAPLLRDRDLEGKNVTVMGWGDESFGGKSSRVLKEATFPVVSRRLCNASYVRVASNRFPKGITDGMLCAGDPNGGKDACQGDSGGPLTSIERGRYTQVGIVSFGYQCGDKEYPGVYTKVAPFLSWIAESTIGNQDYGTGDYDYY